MSEKVSNQTPNTEQTQEAPNPDGQVPCEVYSRIVGYVRPVRNWNQGKRQEFAERQVYRVEPEPIEPECAPADDTPADRTSTDA